MSESGEKSSKTNGLSDDPLQRLASFKPPRDLSLGGVKHNKKIFTPNLNVTRNKTKSSLSSISKDKKNNDKGKRDYKNDRNRNLRNVPNIIKAAGVFSEGLGATERHSSRISYGRDLNVASTFQKPTLKIKDTIRIDKELEDQKIKSIVGENNMDEEVEDFKLLKEKDTPVKLPMDDGGWTLNKAARVKQEVIVKDEPIDEADGNISPVGRPCVAVKEEVFEDNDVGNLIRSDKTTLILLQLPDTLPGRGGSTENGAAINTDNSRPSTSDNQAEEKQSDNRCRLSQLEEGRIGTLRRHRSGRVTLKLGDSIFQVCSGTKASFHQEVVSVAVDDTSRSANLVALGPLQHKLTVIPDWESMFCDIKL